MDRWRQRDLLFYIWKIFKDIHLVKAMKTKKTRPHIRPVKLRDYVCHTLTDNPAFCSPHNIAKWTKLWIKVVLLLNLTR
jgi:hypothetical protein